MAVDRAGPLPPLESSVTACAVPPTESGTRRFPSRTSCRATKVVVSTWLVASASSDRQATFPERTKQCHAALGRVSSMPSHHRCQATVDAKPPLMPTSRRGDLMPTACRNHARITCSSFFEWMQERGKRRTAAKAATLSRRGST